MRFAAALSLLAGGVVALGGCARGCGSSEPAPVASAGPREPSALPARLDGPLRGCTEGPALPAPRYAHASVSLPDGTAILVGGRSATHGAVADAVRVRADGSLRPAGRLAEARFGSASVILLDGSVMILGGLGDGGALASVELYDGARDAWSKGAPLTAPRAYPTATSVVDGRVVVIGGTPSPEAAPHASIEAWSREDPVFRHVAEMAHGRSAHGAVMLSWGDIVIAGGVGTDPAAALPLEIFDVIRNVVRPLPPPPVAWSPAFGLLARDGRPLLFGRTPDGPIVATYFDLRSQWLIPAGAEPLSAPSTGELAYVTTREAEVFVASAGTLARWDRRSLRLAPTATLRYPRLGFALTPLEGGRVFVSGGRAREGGEVLATTEVCDLSP